MWRFAILKHTLDNNRFHDAMIRRGWKLDSNQTWIGPPGKSRVGMEKDFKECIIESIHCPHEEAGTH